jgi:hypothetical protein
MGMVNERGQDDLWLEDMGTCVAVHLVQVKAGGRGMELGCGKSGTTSSDTLATIAWRMLYCSWPDVHKALTPAVKASDRSLELGTITLLTTKHVDPADLERFATLTNAEPWFVVDGHRHRMRIVNDLSLVVRPESRGFYL